MKNDCKTRLIAIVLSMLSANLKKSEWSWFLKEVEIIKTKPDHLYVSFVAINRIIEKRLIFLKQAEKQPLNQLIPAFNEATWDVHRLARLALLLSVEKQNSGEYVALIERLFQYADVNEQVSLYSALPLLEYPDQWKWRCAEGIRSNIGAVLEAIMYENPYPANYLDDPAWNQLVLKAFFTDKELSRIVGLDRRMNPALVASLLDYAKERTSAGRTVDPALWVLVAPTDHFILKNP